MRYIFIICLLFTIVSAQAQENTVRAESLAAMAVGKEAEGSPMEEVSAILGEAAKAAPSHSNIYTIWGFLAMKRAEKQKDAALYELSFEKFEKSTELKPASPEVFSLWAGALFFYADLQKENKYYEEGYDKLQKAIDTNPDYIQAYIVWAQTLTKLAMEKDDATLYKQSLEKYDDALRLDNNSFEANTGKGYACLSLIKLEKDPTLYYKGVEDSYMRAEQMGSQSAAYNLACYYSIIKEKEEACKWLEKTLVKPYNLKMTVLNKKRIDNDEDFNNIRRDKRYKALMKQYFSKQ